MGKTFDTSKVLVIRMKPTLVPRPLYDEVIDSFVGTPEVKVLVGVRRCGKSSLLSLLARRLQERGVPERCIVQLKLDGYDVPLNPDAAWLDGQIRPRLAKVSADETAYVLLDEVQEVDGWEDVVRRVNSRPNTQVFITGSNARLLSGELATLLSGRYVEIPVYPLGFEEYLAFGEAFGWDVSSREGLLADYVAFGGMPALFSYARGDVASYERVLSGIFDTVILKDVVARSHVKDVDLLAKIVRYVFSTSGNLFSTKRVVDALVSSGRKVSQETVDNYLSALVDAKVMAECEQLGLAGKDVLRPQRKFYPVDNGLRNLTIGFNRTRDMGYQLEAVVFNELVRRGWRVNVGTLPSGEVDLVAGRRDERVYIQVCQSVLDDTTFNREVAPLEAVHDSFPKIVMVADRWKLGTTPSGVRIQNLMDWLLGEQ